MKMKVIGMLAAFTLAASAAAAQELPRKVNNVEVLDLDGNPAKLPHWGEKNLMIFYVAPSAIFFRISSEIIGINASVTVCVPTYSRLIII